MAGELFESGLTQSFGNSREKDKKIYGVTPATVIDNVDCMGEARVQLRLAWLPGYEPWARVATPMAGMGRGAFFIPQIGDEVMVAFNQGDVREPYVIGSLWNTIDRPPALAPSDAITKRSIRTPFGQEVTFDEATQSVTIRNTTQHTLSLDPTQAQLATGLASVTLDVAGNVTITAIKELTLQANMININGGKVNINAVNGATVNGGTQCSITATQVDIF